MMERFYLDQMTSWGRGYFNFRKRGDFYELHDHECSGAGEDDWRDAKILHIPLLLSMLTSSPLFVYHHLDGGLDSFFLVVLGIH